VQLHPPAESAHGQVGCPIKHFGKPGMQDRHCAPGQKGVSTTRTKLAKDRRGYMMHGSRVM
jgi:hypothetical protein